MNAYHDHTDTELAVLLGQGDKNAFEAIYRRYASGLYRYARKNIALKEDCEEIVQEVFESLWARRENLGHISLIGGYLFRMVKYKVIRYFQHSTVRKKYAEHYRLFEVLYDSIADEDRQSDSLQVLIDRSLSQLPDRCRLVVKLRLTEDLSNSEIADRMKIKKSTVENYMVTALSHLREVSRPEIAKHLDL